MSGPHGKGTPCRPFTPIDAVLVATSLAISCAGILHQRIAGIESEERYAPPDQLIEVPTFATEMVWYGDDLLVPASCAWLVIRFLRPRPDLRRLFRQPGMIAVASALGYLVLGNLSWLMDIVVATLSGSMKERNSLDQIDPWDFLTVWSPLGHSPQWGVGYAVLTSWALLALGRRCRRERGWIDATGTAIGVGWVLVVVHEIFFRDPVGSIM